MELSESKFLEKAKPIQPRIRDGVLEKFTCPPFPKPDAPPEKKAELTEAKTKYQEAINEEFAKFVNDQDCAIYLVFQPIYNAASNNLTGLEVLCRIENGKDDAPMPGLAIFQVTQKANALKFLKKQTEFAVNACKQLPETRISVNVRADELPDVKEFLIEKAKETTFGDRGSNLLIEITEYAPIVDSTLALIKELKAAGVVFALDDVTETVGDDVKGPLPAGMAKASTHSCSFKLAKENADLFAVQKLYLGLSCSVFRKKVFTTPQFAGGTENPYFAKMIFKEEELAEIEKRRSWVEEWFAEVYKKNPNTTFVIECSVYRDDLNEGNNKELYPNIPIFDGQFDIQGGLSGGRGFPLEAFLPQSPPIP